MGAWNQAIGRALGGFSSREARLGGRLKGRGGEISRADAIDSGQPTFARVAALAGGTTVACPGSPAFWHGAESMHGPTSTEDPAFIRRCSVAGGGVSAGAQQQEAPRHFVPHLH